MITSWKYFLVVAEELNISRAAKKLFISQQSLSQQIQRLERAYNTELFHRKPSLSLTTAGVALFNMITKVQVLENGLIHEMDSMRSDCYSAMAIGITPSRALVYMSDVAAKFHELYPYVEVNLPYSTSENLVSKLCHGILDMYRGLGPIAGNGLEIVPLCKERAFVIVSENLLRKHRLLDLVAQPSSFKEGIDVHLLEGIPYLSNNDSELVSSLYNRYFIKQDIHLSSPFRSDDSQLRTKMCAMNVGMTLVVEPMILYAIQYNALPNQKNPLYILPVKDFTVTSCLAYHKVSFLPHYMQTFVNCVQAQAQSCTYEKYMELYASHL